MKRILLTAAAAVALAVSATFGVAHADPPTPPWQNPHWPDYSMNHCPGGVGGFYLFYCDGERYPDGSYWHQMATNSGGGNGTPECMDSNGQPAEPGACGGEFKG